jgi:predicted dehydrogenase
MNGYVQELADFYRCMAGGRPSFCGGELGYDTVSVIYSAYLSAERRGEEVDVPRE